MSWFTSEHFYLRALYLCLNFFFQAEDGIRDKLVTGVQTCALPISVLGLRCCVQAFSSCRERGLLFVAVHRLLTAVASLVAEHGL